MARNDHGNPRSQVASMTGFASVSASGPHCEVQIEIRSVNSRYLDLVVRVPRAYSPLEGYIRECVTKVVKRGRVELSVQRLALREAPALHFHKEIFDRYVALTLAESERLAVEPRLTMGDIVHMLTARGVLEGDEPSVALEAEREIVETAVVKGLAQLTEAREREGSGLRRDIESRVESLAERFTKVEAALPKVLQGQVERWKSRIATLFEDVQISEERIVAELALRAERGDVAEELTRARGHLEAISQALSAPPCGRRLDFLVQELSREISTSLAKVQDTEVTPILLDCRLLAEQIREQVQNLE